jgi:outer membrane protein insertion porin family
MIRHRTRTGILALLLGVAFSYGKTLDTLIVEGASIHQPSIVRNSFGIGPGQEFTPIDLQNAIRNLYYLGLFSDIDVYSVNETDSSVSLVVAVTENVILESIEFSGAKKLKPKDLREKLTLNRGQVLSEAQIYESVRLLKDAYAEKGYLLAEIDTQVIATKTPGNVILKFDINEGRQVKVKQIEFAGNKAFEDKKLKRKFKTKENKWYTSGDYDEELYDRHLDSLVMFYRDKGYLDARVVNDSVWYGDNKRDIFIRITLDEGPRYYAGDVYFAGNTILETEALADKVALKEGKPFQQSHFDMTKALIGNAYREEGYLWVQLNEEMRYRGDTIDVVFNIQEGRPAIVDLIDIAGNEKTLEKVIRRELRLLPGEKYRQSDMERSIREVMQLNYFNNVTPDLRPNNDGTIDLVFDVDEKDNIGQFSAGVMYSQIDGFGGNLNVTIPNFRGTGQEVGANIEFSKYRQDISLQFKEPWLFDTPTSVNGRVFFQRLTRGEDENKIETMSYGLVVGAGQRLTWPDDYYRYFVYYRLSKEDDRFSSSIGDRNKPLDIGNGVKVLNGGWLSKVSFTLERNDTDLPTFPTRGSKFFSTTEIAGLGGSYSFIKETVGYDLYLPLFWKFVLGGKARMGALGGFGGAADISYKDLFTGGGVYYDGVIRGYDEETFGGRFHMEEGKTMLTLSTELRFPILDQQLYFGVFGDVGNTWSSLSRIDLTDLYTGVGFGVRLMFPMIGLLGFDFAWGLDDPLAIHDDPNPHGFQLHFLMNKGF